MFFLSTSACTVYAIIAPFMPFEIKKMGIDESWLGFIFSVYSVGVLVGSPISGKLLPLYGSRNVIRWGITIMGCSFILFGSCEYIKNHLVFMTVALSVRFVEGFATSMMLTAFCSICTNQYPDRKEELIGYLEAFNGIGLVVGPIIGSALYSIIGFSSTFLLIGIYFIIMSL